MGFQGVANQSAPSLIFFEFLSCNIDYLKLSDNDLVGTFFKINDELDRILQVVDAKDKSGLTPLHWAVTSLLPDVVKILLDNGANLSSFVFPIESHFKERIEDYRRERIELKLRVTAGALGVVENLEKGGFELDRSDAITIMNLFAKYKVFEKSSNFKKLLSHDKKFETRVKKMMVKPKLIHARLPILCCVRIIENLKNEDLYHICLAATGLNS
ncbi:hypothetical protein TKK_0013109 [Trichogramma kaykai]